MGIDVRIERIARMAALAGALALAGAAPRVVHAQGTITVANAGTPVTVTITNAHATAGSEPMAVVSSATTYTCVVVGVSMRITAQVSVALPTGVTLRVRVVAPTGATSAGWVTLSTTAANVVTAIPAGTHNGAGQIIQYELTGTTSAGVILPSNLTVTFTIGT